MSPRNATRSGMMIESQQRSLQSRKINRLNGQAKEAMDLATRTRTSACHTHKGTLRQEKTTPSSPSLYTKS
ncbi:unnamed protein product [Prunus armeniaca]